MKRLSVFLLLMSICMGQSYATTKESQKASQALGASQVSEISFEAGQVYLSDGERAELKKIIEQAKKSGEVEGVQVMVWADREYPVKDTKAAESQVKLASERASFLRNYLEQDLKVSDVKTFNMAKRPNTLQKFFRTQTAEVKQALEKSGAAPQKESETGILDQKAQASKALIMIYMKRE